MKKFKDRLKILSILYLFFVLLGVIALIFGFIKKKEYGAVDYPYFEYLISTGTVLLLIGLLKLKKNLTALLNKTKREEIKIEVTDERNIQLAYKSAYFAFLISIFSLYCLSLYFVFVQSPLFDIVSNLACFFLVVYSITYFVMKKVN